jgi:beta-lactamase class C
VVARAEVAGGLPRQVSDEVILPLMQQHGIPGMAVGIITPEGQWAFCYGAASTSEGKPVSEDTLFEIGSLSKTFTATLACYAEVKGKLSLSDPPGKFVPALQGTNLDRVTLRHLATHTSGGMPLQFPETVTNDEQMMTYLSQWTPAYSPGAYRTYANPSIGLLGLITARAFGVDFVPLMQGTLYPLLGLKSTYLEVPPGELGRYAQGYSKTNEPIRMSPGVFDAEAYGARSTVRDMLRWVAANLGQADLDGDVQKAIRATHTGYYRVGPMIQDLIWEQYSYPVDLADLLTGNSAEISYQPNPVVAITPPLAPQRKVWINKTGSTNGFGAYVAFVPETGSGIVLLANRNYPVAARVKAAHSILSRLDGANP